MAHITSATISLAKSSKFRTKAKMSKKALLSAFYENALMRVANINGRPWEGLTCLTDFIEGAEVELREGDDFVAFFKVNHANSARFLGKQCDIPPFMVGHAIELD